MLDSFGDGWNGANWTITDTGGNVVDSGSLGGGSSGMNYVEVGSGVCDVVYPPQDCEGAITICDDSTFGGNSDGSGLSQELNATNSGCLGVEHQSTWFVFSPTTTGTIEFTLTPTNGIDYDFAIWGPYDDVPCPPAEAPLRCSYSALYAPTGLELNTPEGDVTESPGGDAWVEAITVTPAEVDLVYLMLIDNFTADNTSFNFDWDLTGVILNCQIMLPVDFVEVTGTWENEFNLISWTTGSEVNTHHFDIQRSADLQEWTTIESLSAAGFSTQHEHYSFRDFSRKAEEPYYRVKEVDINGQAIYSETIRVQPYQQEAMTHLFPNPASTVVTFTLNEAILNPVAKIRDCKGVLLREVALVCPGGTCQLDVSDLEDGCYVFELTDSEGGELNTERFVKITDR